jgi:subtilase family serine protease
MKKLWSHGWFAGLLAGVAFLLIPTVSAGADTSTTIQGKAPAAVPANESSPTPSGELIEFDVGIELKDLAGAEALAKEVTDPTSRSYRRFLSPQQWESRFSPSAKADKEVEASLRAAGIKIAKVAPDRMTIVAEGTAEQIEAYFETKLADYEVGEETLRLASSSLSAPTNVAPLITGVRGVNEIHAKPANLTGTGFGGWGGREHGDHGHGPWGWSGHGHGHGHGSPGHGGHGHGHWPPPQEEEVEEIEQPAGFRNATPCSAYYGQELASTLPEFGDGFPNPLPYAPCGYKPAQLQGAYNLAGPISQGLNGSGVTVAIVDAYVSPTLYSDAVEYAQKNQGTTSHGYHGAGGSQQWQPGQFKEMIQRPFTKTEECEAPGWSGEQTLDVEAVHAMAPGAKVLYVGGKNCTVALYNAVQEVVDGHLANIVSDSWSNGPEEEEGETTESREAFNHVLLMAAGTGVGVQFSSGDEGDNFIVSGKQQPSFPGTSPYATAVGGTSVEIGAQNNRLGEVGWSTGISALCTAELAEIGLCEASEVGDWEPEAPGEYDYGGGGGTTNQYAEPWYQEPVVPKELAEKAGTGELNRVVPDISMEGDPSTGMLVGETQVFADGTYYDQYRIGGTSLSSPLFAGLMADADQAARGSLGFVNPLLYHLDAGSQSSGAFYDILPAGKQAVVRNDYLNEQNAEEGILTSARILGMEGATEFFCPQVNEETGECEVEIEEAPESLSAAPGFDSMTGIGSPGDQFIQEVIRH